jgi:hypothetical protein
MALVEMKKKMRKKIPNNFLFCATFSVLPENPLILDRWGRTINNTVIGPMEEGDDVILSCRVIGGT